MKTLGSAALIAVLAIPSFASAAKPYEVIRPDDGKMSCEQLATEINALNAAVQNAQQAEVKRQERGRMAKGLLGGLAGGALAAAPSILGNKLGADYATQYAVSGAVQNMRNGVSTAPAAAAPVAPATVPPEQQRLNYISGLFRDKPC